MSSVRVITSLALTIHLMFGCCWHHAHAHQSPATDHCLEHDLGNDLKHVESNAKKVECHSAHEDHQHSHHHTHSHHQHGESTSNSNCKHESNNLQENSVLPCDHHHPSHDCAGCECVSLVESQTTITKELSQINSLSTFCILNSSYDLQQTFLHTQHLPSHLLAAPPLRTHLLLQVLLN